MNGVTYIFRVYKYVKRSQGAPRWLTKSSGIKNVQTKDSNGTYIAQ